MLEALNAQPQIFATISKAEEVHRYILGGDRI